MKGSWALRGDITAFEGGVTAHRKRFLGNALNSFGEFIAYCHDSGATELLGEATLHVAEILAEIQDAEGAAAFLGLTVSLRCQSSVAPSPGELQRTGSLVRALQSTLGSDEFEELLAAGAVMPLFVALRVLEKATSSFDSLGV
ncbi:MAG TPA: hypothetical protein VHE55_10030 [Fimbriimonadaceae bacterium]|nr:hypothetical protein [Fimbriimonadaceae bacterium]